MQKGVLECSQVFSFNHYLFIFNIQSLFSFMFIQTVIAVSTCIRLVTTAYVMHVLSLIMMSLCRMPVVHNTCTSVSFIKP